MSVWLQAQVVPAESWKNAVIIVLSVISGLAGLAGIYRSLVPPRLPQPLQVHGVDAPVTHKDCAQHHAPLVQRLTALELASSDATERRRKMYEAITASKEAHHRETVELRTEVAGRLETIESDIKAMPDRIIAIMRNIGVIKS